MQIFMGGRGNGKSTEQIIVAISEGNPGCIQFCCELLSKGGHDALLMLTEAGLKGSRHISSGTIAAEETRKKPSRCFSTEKMAGSQRKR